MVHQDHDIRCAWALDIGDSESDQYIPVLSIYTILLIMLESQEYYLKFALWYEEPECLVSDQGAGAGGSANQGLCLRRQRL